MTEQISELLQKTELYYTPERLITGIVETLAG